MRAVTRRKGDEGDARAKNRAEKNGDETAKSRKIKTRTTEREEEATGK